MVRRVGAMKVDCSKRRACEAPACNHPARLLPHGARGVHGLMPGSSCGGWSPRLDRMPSASQRLSEPVMGPDAGPMPWSSWEP